MIKQTDRKERLEKWKSIENNSYDNNNNINNNWNSLLNRSNRLDIMRSNRIERIEEPNYQINLQKQIRICQQKREDFE